MAYQIIQSEPYWDCVSSLRRDDPYKSHLVDTLDDLRRQPFGNPRLSTHDIGTARNGRKLFSSDVGGRTSDRRVVWQIFGQTIVVLLYGNHKVQDRAKRMQISFDQQQQLMQVYEQAPDSEAERPYREHRKTSGTLFMAWTDRELASLGFPEPTVEHLRRLNSEDELLALEENLGPQLFELAVEVITVGPPVRTIGTATALEAPEPPVSAKPPVDRQPEAPTSAEASTATAPATPPEVSDEDRELERLLNDEQAGALFTRLEPEFMAEVIGRPIEDWMIFLHPDQRSTATRRYQGPARVRGPAGTGKTVVGLHRAAHLAARSRAAEAAGPASDSEPTLPVLVTTYISSLPPVFEELYGRMPGTQSGEVEFLNVDKLARQVCKEAEERAYVNSRKVDTAYEQAFKQVVLPGTPLHGLTSRYLQDEITKMIKGRAIESLEDYLGMERTGRRMRLGRLQRTQVWELMECWDAEMDRHGTMDFCDVILRALWVARESTRPRYSAVIVDEAQDLTMAGLQFLRALVNAPDHDVDRPDGLFILGDGAQRIYPGGFTLRQAGVEVRGRTTVLTENYRNTGEIISAALAVAGDHRVEDLSEEFQRGDETITTSRQGPRPLRIEAQGWDNQAAAIAQCIQDFIAEDTSLGHGGMAVLVSSNNAANGFRNRLEQLELAVQPLENYDGQPNDKVKVGTYHRAKGLEFKVVFLPQLGRFPPDPRKGQGEEEAAEDYDLHMSQLFVAMTRARDRLVVLHSPNGSKAIDPATDYFE